MTQQKCYTVDSVTSKQFKKWLAAQGATFESGKAAT